MLADDVRRRAVGDGEHEDVAVHLLGRPHRTLTAELVGQVLGLADVGADEDHVVAARERAGGDRASHVAGAGDRDVHARPSLGARSGPICTTATWVKPASSARRALTSSFG